MIAYANHTGLRSPHPMLCADYDYLAPLPIPDHAFSSLIRDLPNVIDRYSKQESGTERKCKKCGKPFDPEQFYKRSHRNGYMSTCKECHKKNVMEYRK